jgi:hypothetical protein
MGKGNSDLVDAGAVQRTDDDGRFHNVGSQTSAELMPGSKSINYHCNIRVNVLYFSFSKLYFIGVRKW